jgi:hypothetical protein
VAAGERGGVDVERERRRVRIRREEHAGVSHTKPAVALSDVAVARSVVL